MSRLTLILVLAIPGLLATLVDAGETVGGRTMGTSWTATWHGSPRGTDAVPPAAVGDELRRLLERVDRLMSTWREDSEVSRFNTASSTDWFPVSPETARVVSRALEVSSESDGAFDVTVSPLVDLWGFGSKSRQAAPSSEELEAARGRVGWEKLEARDDPPAIRKLVPGLSINLSAIAKGYAVDVLGEYLESLLVKGYLVEVGGESRVMGHRPDGAAWRIGVEQPVTGERRVRTVISLSGPPRAIATSGDYRNRRNVGGRVVSHTLDPRTGRPVEHDLAAVTVVAEDCMTADALATTLMVLGPRRGMIYAERKNLAALLLSREGTVIHEESTARYRAIQNGASGSGWWGTWIPVLALVVLAVGGLSAGVLLRGRGLVGSCGGLALLCDSRDDPLCGACGVRGLAENDGETVDVAGGSADG